MILLSIQNQLQDYSYQNVMFRYVASDFFFF